MKAAARYAVIGDPIDHSLSPRIHNALYRALGMAARYEAIRVRRGDLAAFLREAEATGLAGFNATMPHKVDILPLLARAEPEAADSANTVRREGDGWHGTSTDAAGLIEALGWAGIKAEGRRCLILGAGGVSRALAPALARAGVGSVVIANRTPERAESCARLVARYARVDTAWCGLEPDALSAAAASADLVVQTTSLGMAGGAQEYGDTGFIDALPPGAVVVETIYAPLETALLRRARRAGLCAMNGLPMLVGQAVRSHAFWFGSMPPEPLIRSVLSDIGG